VLDLATLYPAPLLAAMLGDFGADVVKVEAADGDPLRRVGALDVTGTAVAWRVAARNKRSVVADPPTAAALAAVADVVIVNQPAAVLVRNRWDATSVISANPRVVYVSLTAFGATGPYADRPGNGSIAEAFGGFAHLNGAAGGPPVLPSLALGDTLAAIAGVAPIIAALFARDTGRGSGARLDLSMYEPILDLQAAAIAAWQPGDDPPTRRGSRIAAAAPRNVYECADSSWIAVSGPTDEQVTRLLTLMGRPDDVARWGRAAQRREGEADALDAAVADWVHARSRDNVLAQLLEARIPAAAVNSIADLAVDPQVQARASLDHALGVTLRPAPEIGQHTDEVLTEWLGEI
jgi:formyl-CoA transferase